jgi:lipopolysaccharide/colanic/teichoic acid biosynthesis glycosyltransferase
MSDRLKRILDVLVSAAALVFLAPFLVCLALLIRRKLGSPVLFRQVRPGRDGKPFVLLKFRSMTDECDEHGVLRPDAERLTDFGKKLRALSVDELPEFWNILRGDMSLVGPRPLLMSYLDLYSEQQARRHEIRPGLTGWAQVNGRNHSSWEDRLAQDVWYVDHRSLLVDLRILLLTVRSVVTRQGISEADSETKTAFRGNQ